MKTNKNLSPAEEYVWKFIKENWEEIPSFSITRLSESANVSTATIVRTIRKKGYSGYTELRQHYIHQQKDYSEHKNLDILNSEIRKAILKNANEANYTIEMLNTGLIEDTIQSIHAAGRVYIFARGFSELVGSEILLKLELMDKNCEMHNDPNIISTISKKLKRNCVIIYISLNGYTKELVESAKTASKNGLTTILITTNSEGTLMNYCTFNFVGYKSELSFFPDYEVRSRLPLQIISRILLDAYAIRFFSKKE